MQQSVPGVLWPESEGPKQPRRHKLNAMKSKAKRLGLLRYNDGSQYLNLLEDDLALAITSQ